jgi:energy-coupling factor transporter ATP-binding protein EcfA2
MIDSISHTGPADRLPPHDMPSEQGVLGCALISAADCVRGILDRFGDDVVFYDLRHQEIWHSMVFLWKRDNTFDVITLQAELKSRGMLDQIGGFSYLSQLQDAVPSAANLSYYLDIVWEKYIARELIRKNIAQAQIAMDAGGVTESFIVQTNERHEQWKKLLERGTVSPKNLAAPNQFADEYYDQWFNRHDDDFGYSLPFAFPLRLRPSETTLLTGDNGSGKSSMLCLLSVVVGTQLYPGEKVVLASMEMPPEVTLWIMARQLLGVGTLERTEQNIGRIVRALAWLNKRVLIYNFLGITDKRDLMYAFQYAAEHHNGKFFIIDNMMKVGIADDDYASQGFFIQGVCDFSIKHKAHTMVVVHENKGDGSTKQKVRGSKQLTDAPNNVGKMERNEKKAEKLEELKAEKRAGVLTEDAHTKAINGLRTEWDSKFVLSKQRWPSSQQNASRWLYFHRESLQFHEEPNKGAFSFIDTPTPEKPPEVAK